MDCGDRTRYSETREAYRERMDLVVRRRIRASSDANTYCQAPTFNGAIVCDNEDAFPFMETVPRGYKQYVLGRVDELADKGYYNCNRFETLDLPYESEEGLTWDIDVNDLFIYCATRQAALIRQGFEKFPIRLVVNKRCSFPQRVEALERRRVSPRRYARTFNQMNMYCFRDYRDLLPNEYPSVTVRELCELGNMHGFSMYAPTEQPIDVDIFFLTPFRFIPRHYRSKYYEVNYVNRSNE
jgi:hypothetical protein